MQNQCTAEGNNARGWGCFLDDNDGGGDGDGDHLGKASKPL